MEGIFQENFISMTKENFPNNFYQFKRIKYVFNFFFTNKKPNYYF